MESKKHSDWKCFVLKGKDQTKGEYLQGRIFVLEWEYETSEEEDIAKAILQLASKIQHCKLQSS